MIQDIEIHLPENVLTNEALGELYPDWPADKIFAKTGIRQRHIAGLGETASDLAHNAAVKLCQRHGKDIDWLLFCTQSPDYALPTTACILQHRLGLPTSCAALDFNLGCSGYVYGLSLAKSLIKSGQASRVLLLTADTYSKYIHPEDKGTRTIFGDAGTATLLAAESNRMLDAFELGSDGFGAYELIVPHGGARGVGPQVRVFPPAECLYMNGPEIFNFTLKAVPKLVEAVLNKAKLSKDEVDLFVFHQANGFMLDHLRRKTGIPKEKFVEHFAHCGNTVSSTIPIVLEHLSRENRLHPGMKVLLVGFGVGYSWGGCILTC